MVAVLSVGGGHDHVLTVGFSIGPTLLRVVLLAAVPLVAGFVLLRGFLAEPDRRTTAAVVGVAGVAAVIELLVSGGLRLPAQVVPLLLAGLTAPMYVVLSRDPRFAPLVEVLRRVAPWLFAACACLALVEFARAWLSAGPDGALPGLHTGVVLALVGLAWFAVARPRARSTTVGVRVAAAVVALALTAGTAHAVVLRPADPVPGVPTAARLALDAELVDVVVVPNRPGWNLVHVAADGAEVGTSADELTPTSPRPGTSGGWAAVELPEGPADVWVRAGGQSARLSTDTGTGDGAPAGLAGPDGPECAGALLGAALAGGAAPARCPADELTRADAGALRETVSFLARQGEATITLAGDGTPRGRAAAAVVRDTAAEHGVAVRTPDRAAGPLLVVSGWTAADTTLSQVAAGRLAVGDRYLAPWLFAGSLPLVAAGSSVPQRFGPADALASHYRAELADDAPGVWPSAAGYQAWLTGSGERDPGALHIQLVDAPDARSDVWTTGSVTAVGGPIDLP